MRQRGTRRGGKAIIVWGGIWKKWPWMKPATRRGASLIVLAERRGTGDPASRTGRLALPLLANSRAARPCVKHSKHDRCAGRLEGVRAETFLRGVPRSGALDARIDLPAAPSLGGRFARRGPDVAFP